MVLAGSCNQKSHLERSANLKPADQKDSLLYQVPFRSWCRAVQPPKKKKQGIFADLKLVDSVDSDVSSLETLRGGVRIHEALHNVDVLTSSPCDGLSHG